MFNPMNSINNTRSSKSRSAGLAAIVSILLFASVFLAGAQAPLLAQSHYIRVSGQATVSVVSDMAVLTIGIVQQAKTPTAVRSQAAAIADRVVRAIEALGIEKRSIRTGTFSIYPVYDPKAARQNEIIGYKVDVAITLTLEDTSLVPLSIETSIGAGANEIRNLDYRKKNEDSLRIDVLVQAIGVARQKAMAMAAALGRNLGQALTVEEQGYSMRSPDSRLYSSKALSGMESEAFSPGSIDVQAEVAVVFELL